MNEGLVFGSFPRANTSTFSVSDTPYTCDCDLLNMKLKYTYASSMSCWPLPSVPCTSKEPQTHHPFWNVGTQVLVMLDSDLQIESDFVHVTFFFIYI